ncbi:Cl- channel, voltage gated [Nodularia spumigena CCY9414]|nr:Cl- channel, voltage gated [Nodularia spumigena CCY9414]
MQLVFGSEWTFACIPILGGLIVGLMRWYAQDFGPWTFIDDCASQGTELNNNYDQSQKC